MQNTKVYLKEIGKNPFRIANDIKTAIMELKKNQESLDEGDAKSWVSGLPIFKMSPSHEDQCFYVYFELNGEKRKIQVFLHCPDAQNEEFNTLLSMGGQKSSREILMACANEVTPKQGYYYQHDEDFPEPVKIFVEA